MREKSLPDLRSIKRNVNGNVRTFTSNDSDSATRHYADQAMSKWHVCSPDASVVYVSQSAAGDVAAIRAS